MRMMKKWMKAKKKDLKLRSRFNRLEQQLSA